MDFPQPLTPARLLRRYKRFLADVAFEDGAEATVHVPCPGAMLGLSAPGARVWLSRAAPGRKMPWSVELVEADGGAPVLVNTARPNTLAAEAVADGAVPELAGYAGLRREAPYAAGRRRIDLLLEAEGRPPCLVEVKGVTLSRAPGLAEWPDCVSSRTAGQLADLAEAVGQGFRAVLLFVVGRADCDRVAAAADLDPAFAQALAASRAAGVETLCYDAEVGPERLRLRGALPFIADA